MSKIILLIIKFLNRINKIIWKIITFLYNFIQIDDVKSGNKPTLEHYRQFKVDDNHIFEPFITIEHKDYKQHNMPF